MTATKLVNKQLQNAMRIFDKLGIRKKKAVKKTLKGIIENKTCVVQKMYNQNYNIRVNKFRESISTHFGNMNLQPIVEEKAEKIIRKSKGYKDWNILAGDASDIFKSHAYKMEKLSRVRDGSTGLTGNGYIMYGININGITHQLEVKDNDIEYIGSELREDMLKKSAKIVDPTKTIAIFDRGHDDIGFIDILRNNLYKFVIRGKKNRNIELFESGEKVKVSELGVGKYKVKLELGTYVYLYIIKKKKRKEPILLYSNIDFKLSEECLEIYKKRWKIEEDYKKHKEFGIEGIRLMSFKKIQNLVWLVQFIIIIGQSIYNEVVERISLIGQNLFIFYERYCKKMCLTLNPMSMLSFISKNIGDFKIYDTSEIPKSTLFGNRWQMKKLGLS